jgi:hypothetical protein
VRLCNRGPILSASLGGIPVGYNIGGRWISGRGPHLSEVGCVSGRRSQSLTTASPTTMPTRLFFLSHMDVKIFLLRSYLDQSTFMYPPNISHAYRGKSVHIPPCTCDRIPEQCRPSYSEHPTYFHGYCNLVSHALPRGARCLMIGHGSINMCAPKAYAHCLFILHALCQQTSLFGSARCEKR